MKYLVCGLLLVFYFSMLGSSFVGLLIVIVVGEKFFTSRVRRGSFQ